MYNIYRVAQKKTTHPENCNFSATDGDIVTKISDFTEKRLYYKP
jgi:hypothetical protein